MGSIRGPLEEAIEESSGDPSEIYRLVASKIFKVPCEEVTEGMENSIKEAVFSEMYGGKPELVKEKFSRPQEIRKQLRVAVARIEDMLQGDDAQAWDEAEKALPAMKRALGDHE